MTTKSDTSLPYVTDNLENSQGDTSKHTPSVTKSIQSLSKIKEYSEYAGYSKLLKNDFRTIELTLEGLGHTRQEELIRIAKKFRMIGRLNDKDTKKNTPISYIMHFWRTYIRNNKD